MACRIFPSCSRSTHSHCARLDRRHVLGGSKLEFLHIPGHTLGNLAFLLDGKYLFTGDSIFIESIARPDLGGRGDTWAPIHYRSLKRLLDLADETLVLPAHFSGLAEGDGAGQYSASLGQLKKTNEGILIKRVNAGLLEVGEVKASELELGKNICALSQAYEEE